MKYRKKPVVIEAIQWTGKNDEEFFDFSNQSFESAGKYFIGNTTNETLSIETLEGTMIANVGDYIIKGVSGEFYPCKPDIFEKTYDKV